ncbi:MAG: hypothetical protein HQ582_08455, partial [Planctomycetes bacterium]|nr:hypothetical protein [Planctomycetota bacterium]
AVSLYREILVKDEEAKKEANVAVQNNLAFLLALRHEDLDEAMKLINGVINSGTDSTGNATGELLDSRAMIHLAQGFPEKALEDLKAAMAKRPSASLYFHRAQALDQLNNGPAATAALKKALELGLSTGRLHPLERPAWKDLLERYPRASEE